MNPATRTKQIKKALKAAKVEILACYSEQPEWTLVRVYERDPAVAALTCAGFDQIDESGRGPHVTELRVSA